MSTIKRSISPRDEATQVFKQSEGYALYYDDKAANEFIGVEYHNFIWAIAEALSIDDSEAAGYLGRGFAMRSLIRAIH